MEVPCRFLVALFFVVTCNVQSKIVAETPEHNGSAEKVLIDIAVEYGAPFAETALKRLHGNLFGRGRAARSTDVIIFNKTDKKFELTSSVCAHGGFSTNLFPDDEISAKESIVYGIESNGFAIGVECTTKYTSRDGTFFEVTVENPYIGSNSVKETHQSSIKLLSTKGQGDNNQVRWIIENN